MKMSPPAASTSNSPRPVAANWPGYAAALLAGLLVLVTTAAYWPATSHDFVNYDDPLYVTSNVHVQTGLTGHNVQWAFCHPVVGNWHPVTMLSHMLDCQIYGLKPWGHHLTNVLLHAVNTALVFLLLFRLTGALWRSCMVAALFGFHPLHVESVAWVAERKDVLSTFFGLLSLLCYAYYAQGKGASSSPALRSSGEGGSSSNPQSTIHNPQYLLSLLFFTLGLMSKPMLVTLPFVMMLLDYWPLRRFIASGAATDSTIQRFNISTLTEKTPFFALAAAMCVVTYLVQQKTGMMDSLETVPLGNRVGNALISYCRYLGKLFWPTNLAVFYPYPEHNWAMGWVLLAGVMIAGISAYVFFQRTRRPCLLIGWLWFCGTLVPVIGLVQVGGQAMADRYTYIPSLGIFILLVWGADELANRWKYRAMALGGAGCMAIILCAGLTWRQLGYWQNNETLYRHALTITNDNYLAHHNLGIALFKEGKIGDAISQYRDAIRLEPANFEPHYDLGSALAVKGQTDEAIFEFQKAIQLNPNYAAAHANLGTALAGKGQIENAINEFREAVRLEPDNAEFQYALGTALGMSGQIDEAIKHFQEALRLQPDFAAAQHNLAMALRIKNAAAGHEP